MKSAEFDLKRPLASALEVLRAIFLSPRAFYQNFDPKGPLREPIVFVLLVSTVAGVLSVVANVVSEASGIGVTDTNLLGVAAFNLVFVVLSPFLVGLAAGAYLLSLRVFVGPQGNLREMYRMLAYAYGAMIFLWVPIVYAFVFTYAAMILMGLGIQSVYRTSFLTTLVTALSGFVPVAVGFAYLIATALRLVSG